MPASARFMLRLHFSVSARGLVQCRNPRLATRRGAVCQCVTHYLAARATAVACLPHGHSASTAFNILHEARRIGPWPIHRLVVKQHDVGQLITPLRPARDAGSITDSGPSCTSGRCLGGLGYHNLFIPSTQPEYPMSALESFLADFAGHAAKHEQSTALIMTHARVPMASGRHR